MRRIIVIIIISFFAFSLPAKPEIAGYPSGGYGNETGFYGGALLYYRFKPNQAEDSTPKNVLYFSSSYTENKQFTLMFQPTIYFHNGLYRMFSNIQYKKWPTKFYGIGMKTDRNYSEKFTPLELKIKTKLTRKIFKNWNIAFCYEFLAYNFIKKEIDSSLACGNVTGNRDAITSGLGIAMEYDTRNSVSYPTDGNFLSLQIDHYNKAFGSDYKFSKHTIDLRKYLAVNSRNTIAVQTFFSSINGDVPFYQMNYLDENMRAITSNLYLDKNSFVLRAEDRVFMWQDGFWQRLGLAAFIEIGEVASQIDKFDLDQLQCNYGLGFRYSFFLEDRLNVRIDVGFGEVKANLSISSGEVF